MTDQRADTPLPEPRTKAGQAMESWLREPEDYAWGRKVTDAILAIEAEAAADSLRSVGPAAAEPPDLFQWTKQALLDAGWQIPLGPDGAVMIQKVASRIEDAMAAQPPRGSLPDVTHFRGTIRDVAPNPVIIEGGSLTATDRPTASEEPPDGH